MLYLFCYLPPTLNVFSVSVSLSAIAKSVPKAERMANDAKNLPVCPSDS